MIRAGLGALALGVALAGCSSVGTAMGGSPQRVGDVWFVRTSSFFGLPMGGGSVWYCPAPPSGTARTSCTEATIDEDDVSPAAPSPEVASNAPPAAPSQGGMPSTPSACGDLRVGVTATVRDEVSSDAPPPALGGVVPDGLYALSRYTWHVPADPHSRRTLLRVRGGRFDMAFARDSEPERILSGRVLFEHTGRAVFTVDCPQEIPLEFVGFSVTPTGLTLHSRVPAKTAIFTRVGDA